MGKIGRNDLYGRGRKGNSLITDIQMSTSFVTVTNFETVVKMKAGSRFRRNLPVVAQKPDNRKTTGDVKMPVVDISAVRILSYK